MLLLYVLALVGLCGRACGAQAGGDSGRAASATGDRPGRAAQQPLPHRPAQWAAVSELQWRSVSVIYCILILWLTHLYRRMIWPPAQPALDTLYASKKDM